jgi:hypothetical protein
VSWLCDTISISTRQDRDAANLVSQGPLSNAAAPCPSWSEVKTFSANSHSQTPKRCSHESHKVGCFWPSCSACWD